MGAQLFSLDLESGKLVCAMFVADISKKKPASVSLNSSKRTLSPRLIISHKISSKGTVSNDPDQTPFCIDGTIDVHNQVDDKRKSEIIPALGTFIANDNEAFQVVEMVPFQNFALTQSILRTT
jgi:hypothetical protein